MWKRIIKQIKMAVRTTTDEKIDNIKELLSKAKQELVEVLNTDTWGNSELADSYIEDLEITFVELSKLQRKL